MERALQSVIHLQGNVTEVCSISVMSYLKNNFLELNQSIVQLGSNTNVIWLIISWLLVGVFVVFPVREVLLKKFGQLNEERKKRNKEKFQNKVKYIIHNDVQLQEQLYNQRSNTQDDGFIGLN